jgi:hypothetical protein
MTQGVIELCVAAIDVGQRASSILLKPSQRAVSVDPTYPDRDSYGQTGHEAKLPLIVM